MDINKLCKKEHIKDKKVDEELEETIYQERKMELKELIKGDSRRAKQLVYKKLNEKEKRLFRLYFAICTTAHTIDEISQNLGISTKETKERIKNLKTKIKNITINNSR